MAPLIGTPSIWTLLIILAIALLLFGGSRLAGIGKSTGRAIKEFKEETQGVGSGSQTTTSAPQTPGETQRAADDVTEAEVVERPRSTDR
ncbi:twin-arginine translocase TatA/TatE family subunit [Naumannella cuiyingiana]|uniref:Sec-independent protein translocase protein TatA n=1 Tax=Naumannella cuiyingiana TaxID=1347891 RepID=A0A7Z0DBA1_9ACTN|nr:sec-independent protein translocase protein TatA [Naumannella cuiyingiana]